MLQTAYVVTSGSDGRARPAFGPVFVPNPRTLRAQPLGVPLVGSGLLSVIETPEFGPEVLVGGAGVV